MDIIINGKHIGSVAGLAILSARIGYKSPIFRLSAVVCKPPTANCKLVFPAICKLPTFFSVLSPQSLVLIKTAYGS